MVAMYGRRHFDSPEGGVQVEDDSHRRGHLDAFGREVMHEPPPFRVAVELPDVQAQDAAGRVHGGVRHYLVPDVLLDVVLVPCF